MWLGGHLVSFVLNCAVSKSYSITLRGLHCFGRQLYSIRRAPAVPQLQTGLEQMPTDPEASVACGMLTLERVLDILNIMLGENFLKEFSVVSMTTVKRRLSFMYFTEE